MTATGFTIDGQRWERCPSCNKSKPVAKDGRLYAHRPCPGSYALVATPLPQSRRRNIARVGGYGVGLVIT